MNWYKLTTLVNEQIVAFYLEIQDDLATRQIERYGDCWVYSDDPESYCPCPIFDAYGVLTPQRFSHLSDDMPFITISEEEFEHTWQIAILKAKKKTVT